MSIKLEKGRLFIDGKEVAFVIFKDFAKMDFPIRSDNQITMEDYGINSAKIKGDGNAIVQNSKNVVMGGSYISAKDIRIGDG